MGLIDFVIPLSLTFVLEGMIAIAWGLQRKNLLLFVLVNVLTNPLAVLLHTLYPGWAVTAALEIGVVAAEALCYDRFGDGIRRPWLFSLLANAFSFFAGLGIDRWI